VVNTTEWPHLREEIRKDQNAYCHQEGHWKNECPQWHRHPLKAPPPIPEAGAKLLKENIGLLRGEVAPGRKTSSDWTLLRNMRRTRTDQVPFYSVPPSKSLWYK
jgi:hypothetical protein